MTTIKEIKNLVPLADTYEIVEGAKYITVVPRSTPNDCIERILRQGREIGMKGFIVLMDDPADIRFINTES